MLLWVIFRETPAQHQRFLKPMMILQCQQQPILYTNNMATFGITLISASGVVVESVDVENKADFKQLVASDGTHYGAYTYDYTQPYSAKGKGSNPYEVGIATGKPSIMSGKVFISSAKKTTKNDDWEGWEISGIGYPHAI